VTACEPPRGYVADGTDCDDGDPEVNPGVAWYRDADGDGYGDPKATVTACDDLTGYLDYAGDCDDTNPTVSPEGVETCDPDDVDEDCDGRSDDQDDDAVEKVTWYVDGDGDGYGASDEWEVSCEAPAGFVDDDNDCDDDAVDISPGEMESCDDRIDNDCDGSMDCGDSSCATQKACDVISLADADASFQGETEFGHAGSALCSGDVNADGYDDVIVGASHEATGGTQIGAVYVLHSPLAGTFSLADADAILRGEGDRDYAGVSVASGADITGDGLVDIVVGATGVDRESTGHAADGLVYILSGAVSGELSLADSEAFVEGGETTAVGYKVAIDGDVDGDGNADLLMGAPQNCDMGGGGIYLLFGPVSGTTRLQDGEADVVRCGVEDGDYVGWVAGYGGDVNADGFDDVITSSWTGDGESKESGVVYLFLGPLSGEGDISTADGELLGEATGDEAGVDAARAGDVNGDGYADIVVGAEEEASGGADAGAAYLVLGPLSGTLGLSSAQAKFIGESSTDYVGGAVSTAGDYNDDGFDDLIIGAIGADDDGVVGVGGAYLVLGPVTGTLSLSAADAKFAGETPAGSWAGEAVAPAGDIDADGYDDFLVGAHRWSGLDDAGAAYLLLGAGTEK